MNSKTAGCPLIIVGAGAAGYLLKALLVEAILDDFVVVVEAVHVAIAGDPARPHGGDEGNGAVFTLLADALGGENSVVALEAVFVDFIHSVPGVNQAGAVAILHGAPGVVFDGPLSIEGGDD